MPSIVQGLGRLWGSADFELDWDTSLFTTGDILLLIVLCVVLIPLGFAKRIDFLGFTSAIGMFAMMSFGKSLVRSKLDGTSKVRPIQNKAVLTLSGFGRSFSPK